MFTTRTPSPAKSPSISQSPLTSPVKEGTPTWVWINKLEPTPFLDKKNTVMVVGRVYEVIECPPIPGKNSPTLKFNIRDKTGGIQVVLWGRRFIEYAQPGTVVRVTGFQVKLQELKFMVGTAPSLLSLSMSDRSSCIVFDANLKSDKDNFPEGPLEALQEIRPPKRHRDCCACSNPNTKYCGVTGLPHFTESEEMCCNDPSQKFCCTTGKLHVPKIIETSIEDALLGVVMPVPPSPETAPQS